MLKQRIDNAKNYFVITVDESVKSGKKIAMKAAIDKVVTEIDFIEVLVMHNTSTDNISWNDSKDICYKN